jgi:hypothetical protein
VDVRLLSIIYKKITRALVVCQEERLGLDCGYKIPGMTIRLVSMLFFIATVGEGCDCIEVPAREAKHYSEIVFRGTIIRLRNNEKGEPMVAFKVTRVWKGPVTAEFEMLGVEENYGCIGFYRGILKLGNEVLVYAHRLAGPDFTPLPCNTTLVQNAKDILKLGRGRKPKSN